MALGTDRGTTRRAAEGTARPAVALALCLIAGLGLSACSAQANRPIPVAKLADQSATTSDPAAPETPATEAAPGAVERVTRTAALPGDRMTRESVAVGRETYEAAVPANPEEVMGLRRDEVQALLGKPGLVRREAPAEVWQYQSRGCVLDVFLYEASADFEVVYIEARNGQAMAAAAATCLGSVMGDRRQMPTS